MDVAQEVQLSAQEVMGGLQRVPALSVTVAQLIELTARDNTNVSDVTQIVGLDPVLSARMLRVANSPFFGVPGGVTSINHACMVLGLNTIRNLALAVGLGDSLNVSGSGDQQRQLWHRSVATAFASQALARRCGESTDVAFTAGMLYNLGKLVMFAAFPDGAREVYSIYETQGCALADAERMVFGMPHRELGELLVRQWQLPPFIQQVVAGSVGEDTAFYPLMDIVSLSDFVTQSFPFEGAQALAQGDERKRCERLALSGEEIEAWLKEVAKQHDMVATLV